MLPAEICTNVLGEEKLDAVISELSSPQIKAVLKEGSVRAKVPGSYVSRNKRLKIWKQRIQNAIADGNDDLASELLQQWLLYHRRPLLIAMLDRLEVKHNTGETDESFLVSRPREKVLDASKWLLATQDRDETRAYLLYIAYQQRTQVFDDWDELENKK